MTLIRRLLEKLTLSVMEIRYRWNMIFLKADMLSYLFMQYGCIRHVKTFFSVPKIDQIIHKLEKEIIKIILGCWWSNYNHWMERFRCKRSSCSKCFHEVWLPTIGFLVWNNYFPPTKLSREFFRSHDASGNICKILNLFPN